ncbi:MAG: helix-turn-helix domain-containing protein [Pseudomonadota bacterium]
MTSEQKPPRLLYPPSQVAEMLGVKEKTLTDWRYKRIGPKCVMNGKRVLGYRPKSIEEWLEQQESSPQTRQSRSR